MEHQHDILALLLPPQAATLILVFIFVVYTIMVYANHGVLSSISASSYRLEKPWWFAGWLGGLALFSFFLQLGFWGHLMAMGFCGAGMSIEHKKGPGAEDEIHTWATIVAVVAGFMGLIATKGLLWPSGAMIVGGAFIYLLTRDKGTHIWWLEIWAMVCIAAGLLT